MGHWITALASFFCILVVLLQVIRVIEVVLLLLRLFCFRLLLVDDWGWISNHLSRIGSSNVPGLVLIQISAFIDTKSNLGDVSKLLN